MSRYKGGRNVEAVNLAERLDIPILHMSSASLSSYKESLLFLQDSNL